MESATLDRVVYACRECDSVWAVEAPRCPLCNSVDVAAVEPPPPPRATRTTCPILTLRGALQQREA